MEKLIPNNAKGAYIFMSYAHANDEQAEKIVQALQKDGYRLWFDTGLELGSEYNQVIAEHIEECEAFICLLTKEYYESFYCKMELNYAYEECQKKVIPIYMGNAREIKNGLPAGMKMWLTGINSMATGEKPDMERLMAFVRRTISLDVCKEPQNRKLQENYDKLDKLSRGLAKESLTSRVKEAEEKLSLQLKMPDVKVGSAIKFGRYPQSSDNPEPIMWKVLEREGNSLLLITNYALDCMPYKIRIKFYLFAKFTTWETSSLRKWLNEEFLDKAFTKGEQKMIETTKVKVEKNLEYDTNRGEDTEDKVFLLSLQEAERYFACDEARQCKATAYAVTNGVHISKTNKYCSWWLRSSGSNNGVDNAASVFSDGSLDYFGYDVRSGYIGVRPALRINLES